MQSKTWHLTNQCFRSFWVLKSPWGAPTNKDLSSMKHASTVGLCLNFRRVGLSLKCELSTKCFLKSKSHITCTTTNFTFYLLQQIQDFTRLDRTRIFKESRSQHPLIKVTSFLLICCLGVFNMTWKWDFLSMSTLWLSPWALKDFSWNVQSQEFLGQVSWSRGSWQQSWRRPSRHLFLTPHRERCQWKAYVTLTLKFEPWLKQSLPEGETVEINGI